MNSNVKNAFQAKLMYLFNTDGLIDWNASAPGNYHIINDIKRVYYYIS